MTLALAGLRVLDVGTRELGVLGKTGPAKAHAA